MPGRLKHYRLNRISGMNMYNSARAAGYSENYAKIACRRLEPKVDFTDILEQAGATLQKIAATYTAALEATKVISCNIIIDKDMNVKNKDADGETNDFIEVTDWQSRLQAANKLCELYKLTNGKHGKEVTSGATVETFFIELLKRRSKELDDGEGIRITRVEHSALDRFVSK